MYHVLDFCSLAFFGADVRSFCTCFALDSLMPLPKLASANELDFCSNPTCSKAIGGKTNYNVSICVPNQGGGINVCYDGGS